MLYEPAGYIVEYEISALVFLLVIMARYFGARRFPNQKNHLFALILWVAAADMALDVVGSLLIDRVFSTPLAVTFLVNGVFYCLQIVLPLLMTAYSLAMTEYLTWQGVRRRLALLLPGAVTIAAMLTNPVTHWFFYVDPVRGYVHGSLFLYTYLVALFYMAATFVIAFRSRARLRKKEFSTICRFLVIVLAAVVVQFFYPPLLISGVAIALAVTLMYFTIQNPDSMLDAATGAFTYEAMLAFLHDRAPARDRVQLVGIKIGNMPRINELLGVENGSLLLEQISRYLRSDTGDSWVFRMRGGCFVVITRRDEDYRGLCARLEERIGQPWVVGRTEVLLRAVVCCVAAAELMSEPISPEETVNYLETIFLQNERSGSRIESVIVGPEQLDGIRRRRAVEEALRQALEGGEGLELYFQPLWSVKRARFEGAEVLLRFRHPVMGFVSPEEFVPIAESCGLVTAMDEMVVRKACAFLRENEGAGPRMLEINLSALEFMHRRLPEMIDGIMRQYQVDPRMLCFEITETAATESFELLKECMLELCKKGCRFALDDFGTGYANISQVIQLPFSMVKMDRSLLFGPEVVLEDLARMFTRMKRITVIEGVESAEQAARAKAIQADYIQGYYYARPMCQGDYLRFLQREGERP